MANNTKHSQNPLKKKAGLLFSKAKKMKSFETFAAIMEPRITKAVERYFSGNHIFYVENQELTEENFDSYYHFIMSNVESLHIAIFRQKFQSYITRNYCKWMLPKEEKNSDVRIIEYFNAYCRSDLKNMDWTHLEDTLSCSLSKENLLFLISQNINYKDFAEKVSEYQYRTQLIQESILERIPDNYAHLYHEARMMNRHFVLHLGPTNSGKTYESLCAFRQAPKAIYLAPLRLLAYEVYESTNREDIPCRMITGEEILDVEGATHQASTIEMLDLNEQYDVAVIDEGQMINNEQRGGFWTEAILGVRAHTIHICASENAKDMLIRLILLCCDSYEMHHHVRQVPLVFDDTAFQFPESVQEKDALIVFSKRSVLACAAVLQKKGILCSVIYGALPYDVRRREVERFVSGETKVVVATDAIGMGLNLPVKRVVLLEVEKFDGTEKRPLQSWELKQIMGRAGRRGMYDVGYYNSEYHRNWVEKQMQEELPVIQKAIVKFPERLINIEGSLSDILKKWNSIPEQDIFQKADISREITLCTDLEYYTDNKQLIYRFITIPFSEKNLDLYMLWKELFFVELDKLEGKSVNSHTGLLYLYRLFGDLSFDVIEPKTADDATLTELETSYQRCDLLCNYYRITGNKEQNEALKRKFEISEKIMELLSESKLPLRKCRVCGKEIPWNYEYTICQKCYDRQNHYYN